MTKRQKNSISQESSTDPDNLRPGSYRDWLYGCIILALATFSVGAGFDNHYGKLFGAECLFCPMDVGGPFYVFAYAVPGIALGSAIWAVQALIGLRRESGSDQFKAILLVFALAIVLLAACFYYLYWLPIGKSTLNVDPELTKSIVKITAETNTYTHPGDYQGKVGGTGILVDAERGWIVTNAHVALRTPSDITVLFSADSAERVYSAEKLYVDPYLDIAILQAQENGYFRTQVPAATLSCENGKERDRGGEIAAIGYAGKHDFRLRYAAGRGLGRPTKYGRTWFATDADYQPGMSGGPTIDRASGRVLGISTLGYIADDSFDLGFTVPARYVCRIVDMLRSGADPTPPRLPVAFFDNLADMGELVVAEVHLSSGEVPLIEGDTILGIEGLDEPVNNESDLIDALRGSQNPVNLRIRREGEERVVQMSLDKMRARPEPDLLYVSSFVIGGSVSSAGPDNLLRRELMIRMPSSSETESTGEDFSTWMRYGSYIIVNVDGIPFDDVRGLYRHLAGVQRSNQEAVFKFKKSRPGKESRDAYLRLRVTPDDLRLLM